MNLFLISSEKINPNLEDIVPYKAVRELLVNSSEDVEKLFKNCCIRIITVSENTHSQIKDSPSSGEVEQARAQMEAILYAKMLPKRNRQRNQDEDPPINPQQRRAIVWIFNSAFSILGASIAVYYLTSTLSSWSLHYVSKIFTILL